MTTAELSTLTLHFPGLLKLLSEHLYSDPLVALRELIQNAHDSCVRRALADERAPDGRITVAVQDDSLVITDNGIGLDRDEIRQFLATIGRGETGQLRAALERDGARGAEDLVGWFGVGLLSAFLVGTRITVVTRRVGAEQGWRWICAGQQTYTLEPADKEAIGTQVRVKLRPEVGILSNTETLRAAAARYCRYLAVPILISGTPINPRALPWEDSIRPRWRPEALAGEWSGDLPPLAIIPLRPFEHPEFGAIALHGLLTIPAASLMSLREYGTVGVLIRRMVVTERDDSLLPRWARFVTGLVDCPALQPTASRESVHRDRMFDIIRAEIESQLLHGLRELTSEQPESWARVLQGHEPLLKRWGAAVPELFEILADRVTFRTSNGRMTLAEYLTRSGGVIYCMVGEQSPAIALLMERASRPIIDARYVGDEVFLASYARTRGVRLVDESAQPDGLLGVAAVPEELEPLIAEIAALEPSWHPVPARFEPTSLPLMLITPTRMELQQFAEERHDRSPVGALLQDFSQRSAPVHRTLYVNIDSPALHGFAQLAPEQRRAALVVLCQMARLLSGERLAANELNRCIVATTEALSRCVRVDGR